MRTKLDLLRTIKPLLNLDFFVTTETNLNNNFFSTELRFSFFNICRCDRDFISHGVTQGGGVLICGNKKYVSLECLEICPNRLTFWNSLQTLNLFLVIID